MIKQIPNLLTLCNLVCGCIAISFCFVGNLHNMIIGSYFVFAAAIFDKDLHIVIMCWAIRINLPYRKIKTINEL